MNDRQKPQTFQNKLNTQQRCVNPVYHLVRIRVLASLCLVKSKVVLRLVAVRLHNGAPVGLTFQGCRLPTARTPGDVALSLAWWCCRGAVGLAGGQSSEGSTGGRPGMCHAGDSMRPHETHWGGYFLITKFSPRTKIRIFERRFEFEDCICFNRSPIRSKLLGELPQKRSNSSACTRLTGDCRRFVPERPVFGSFN